MDIHTTFKLLEKYSIPFPRYTVFRELSNMKKEITEKIGFPAVLKLIAPQIIHKTDAGAIKLGICSWEDLEREYYRMEERFKDIEDRKYLIQKQVPKGVELVIGGVRDKIFGPVVMFGLGGIFVEIYKDVSFRLAPVTISDAYEMIDEIRGRKILEGFRGLPPVNKQLIANVITSVSKLIYSNNEILEIDINPLICVGNEAYAVDVRIITGDIYEK